MFNIYWNHSLGSDLNVLLNTLQGVYSREKDIELSWRKIIKGTSSPIIAMFGWVSKAHSNVIWEAARPISLTTAEKKKSNKENNQKKIYVKPIKINFCIVLPPLIFLLLLFILFYLFYVGFNKFELGWKNLSWV